MQGWQWAWLAADGRSVQVLPARCGADGRLRVSAEAGRLRLQDLGATLQVTGDCAIDGQPSGGRQQVRPGQQIQLGREHVLVVQACQRHGQTWLRLGEFGSAEPALWRAWWQLVRAAATPWPVVLRGASGTGKELAARLVHSSSPRRSGPMVAVNCGALHGDTLLAELFGAVRGAYTGAVHDRKGAFERADGGTLFLDEVAELSPEAQAALLRALESGEVQVLGGPAKRVSVRLVCASHRDLYREVERGRFRLDLLHRLAVAEVTLPSLRERPADLLCLLEDWLGQAELTPDLAPILRAHPWPGNVRELRNVARRLEILGSHQAPTSADLRQCMGRPVWALAELPTERPAVAAPPQHRQERRRHVADLLAQSSNPAEAWRRSGLPKCTFYRYVRQVLPEQRVS
jgi:DNA-binding NtrC family response regulator